MNRKTLRGVGLMLSLLLLFAACNNDKEGTGSTPIAQNNYKVAVVMPKERWDKLERVAQMLKENITKAQEGLSQQTHLELEWIDEQSADWQDKVKTVVADTTYRAIVGPDNSDDADIIAKECATNDKTLMMPTITSAELQRTCAGKGFVWCLSEPDIAQCEVMLTNAQLYGALGVYLVVKNNSYGQTFLDWIGFQATELGMKVYKTWTYDSAEELKNIVTELDKMVNDRNEVDPFQSLLFVPSGAEDMVALDKAFDETQGLPLFLHTICSNSACSADIASKLKDSGNNYEGYVLSASPSSGFNQTYSNKYGELPLSGEAHFYDALLLLYYGMVNMETKGDGNLNEALKRVVDGREGVAATWMKDDIRNATTSIRAGGSPNVDGTTGQLEFDAKKYTTVLHSVYSRWVLKEGSYRYVGYESTDGSLRTSSSSAVWDWNKTLQNFDQNVSVTYPKLHERWALVIATSTSWANYRHQADAFAMYQVLKRHGYDDDHIVLIVSDDYAYNTKNVHQGEIRVRENGANVYEKSAIDYDIKDLSPSDLKNILSGNKTEQLNKVLSPDADDNVFVFWSGHGLYGSLKWREDGKSVSAYEMSEMLRSLSDEKKFRQMLFAIEACNSGSIGEACVGIPGLLMITAANSYESSWAEQKDSEMRVYLSNAFTRTFEETIDEQPSIKIRNLYYNLARTTSGSHVMVYNEQLFGNLYDTPMTVFLNE